MCGWHLVPPEVCDRLHRVPCSCLSSLSFHFIQGVKHLPGSETLTHESRERCQDDNVSGGESRSEARRCFSSAHFVFFCPCQGSNCSSIWDYWGAGAHCRTFLRPPHTADCTPMESGKSIKTVFFHWTTKVFLADCREQGPRKVRKSIMCVHLCFSLKPTLTACWTARPCWHFIFHLASSINHSTPIQYDARGHPSLLAPIIPLCSSNVQPAEETMRRKSKRSTIAALQHMGDAKKEKIQRFTERFGPRRIGYGCAARRTDKRLGLGLRVSSRLCFEYSWRWHRLFTPPSVKGCQLPFTSWPLISLFAARAYKLLFMIHVGAEAISTLPDKLPLNSFKLPIQTAVSRFELLRMKSARLQVFCSSFMSPRKKSRLLEIWLFWHCIHNWLQGAGLNISCYVWVYQNKLKLFVAH